jgi:hypothetical protein
LNGLAVNEPEEKQQTKKNPRIHTCVDLSGFEDGGSCGIRTQHQSQQVQAVFSAKPSKIACEQMMVSTGTVKPD